MKKTIVFLFSLFALFGQAQTYNYSATTGDVSLSSAGTSFTIQQPATNGKNVKLSSALVYCSVACDITQAQNGTAATATAGTATAILPGGLFTPATATVWTASNVGSGTAVGGTIHQTSQQYIPIDLSKISMGNTGKNTNYTITISSITGTANITLFWTEAP